MDRIERKQNIRRILSLSLVLILLLSASPVGFAAEASGTCGGGLSWELTEGTLTVFGSGAMDDYSPENSAPWYEYRNDIRALSLSDGITSLGSYAFSECAALERVSLPDSVERIGEKAFYGCTGIKLLALSPGLKTIGERAFERCWSLPSLILPNGLEAIGDAAFWRCHGLLAVTVPESVTDMGTAVFAYCDGMIQADIRAQIDILPEWTFYGCDNLSSVTLADQIGGVEEYAFTSCENLCLVRYQGGEENAGKIAQDIGDYLDTFDPGYVVATSGNSSSSTHFSGSQEQPVIQTNTVTQTGNSTVNTQITSGDDGVNVQIGGVVENGDGWQDLLDQTDGALDSYENTMEGNVKVEVSILDGSGVTGEQISGLAGKPVELTVQTMTGESWTVDLSTMDAESLAENYDLSYNLTGTQVEELEGEGFYALDFHSDTEVNAEIMIRLPVSEARKNGTLFYQKGGKWVEAQRVVVDQNGYAHFYLANVEKDTQYLVGVNVPGEDSDDAIVPDNMKKEFDITDTLAPMDYVITGRKSSWNMELGQVTLILVGVLVASVAVVGVVLYLMNKRKLKKGYVVDLDDYELDN